VSIPNLTESTIREHTESGSFERGERYFTSGAVRNMDVRPGKLEAFVEGSAPNPYVVNVQFDREEGVRQVRCTCPYHEGSWCKHIVAALLAHLRKEEGTKPSLRSLLESRSREELVALIERLAERDARVRQWTEEEVA
jgi:uncharacterized Zn finger protein